MMKNISLKNAVAAASFLAVISHAGIAPAHEQTGSLGKDVGATDLYQVSCSTDSGGVSDHLVAQVLDSAPSAKPMVSVQLFKGAVAANSTDATDADTAYSPEVSVSGGNGAYYVIVDKTAAGAENYTLEYHCQSSTGAHTGTAIVPLQSQ